MEEPVSEDSASEDSDVEDSVSEDSDVEDSVSEDSDVEDSVSEDSVSEDSVSEDSVSVDSVSVDSVSGKLRSPLILSIMVAYQALVATMMLIWQVPHGTGPTRISARHSPYRLYTSTWPTTQSTNTVGNSPPYGVSISVKASIHSADMPICGTTTVSTVHWY